MAATHETNYKELKLLRAEIHELKNLLVPEAEPEEDETQLRETKKHPHPFDFTQKPKKAKAKPLQNHYLSTHSKSAIFHLF